MDFAVLTDQRVKLKENEKKDKYFDLEKTVEHESDVYTNSNWCSWYSHRRIIKRTRGLGNKRTCGDHQNYFTAEIGQNTEKSPGDLRILADIKTSVKDQQTLIRKIPDE